MCGLHGGWEAREVKIKKYLIMATQDPKKTPTAVPERDEAKAQSAKDSSCGGAAHFKGTVRPFHLGSSGSKSGPAQQVFPRKPTGAGATGAGRGTTATFAKAPLPNLGKAAPGALTMATPQGVDVMSGGGAALSRRQKRRANMRARASAPTDVPPMPATPQKRVLGNNDSPVLASDSKRTRVGGSFADVAACEKVAIVPAQFPAKRTLSEHLGAIQGAMLELLADAPDPLPRVTLGNIVGGALHAQCQGKESSTWLSTAIEGVEIAGLRFRVMDAKDLPKPVKMAWKTKIVGGHDLKLLLRVLQRFNPLLHTDEWKVVDTVVSDAGTRRIILMDRVSADVIKAAGYQLHTGVDLSAFKLLEDAEREKGLEGAATNPSEGKGKGEVAQAPAVEATPKALAPVELPSGSSEGKEAEGQSREAGGMVPSEEVHTEPRITRESTPLSPCRSEDYRGLEELYLDSTLSPMSLDETVQEVADDLSRKK